MTQSIRDAAQALLDAIDSRLNDVVPYEQVAGLRAALSAPQPTADERVAEHMRRVDFLVRCEYTDGRNRAAVEQSARALLSASQEDAEHAAMYRWLRDRPYLVMDDSDDGGSFRSKEKLDAATRAAMSAKEDKKLAAIDALRVEFPDIAKQLEGDFSGDPICFGYLDIAASRLLAAARNTFPCGIEFVNLCLKDNHSLSVTLHDGRWENWARKSVIIKGN